MITHLLPSRVCLRIEASIERESAPRGFTPSSREPKSDAMQALRVLQQRNLHIQAAACFDLDGALVASVDDGAATPEVFASFVASLRTLGERTSTELGAGVLETLLLDGKDGRLVIAEAGDCGYVAALVQRDAALGQVLVDVRACARAVEADSR